MSRIGKLPIVLPAKVDVSIKDGVITVKGPKGELSQKLNPELTIKVEDGHIYVERPNDERQSRAQHGLYRALIHNMVVGVTTGFEKKLEINGTGYRAQKTGNKLVLNVGYSHPVEFEDGDVTFEVPAPNRITVKGISKQRVGQVAAEVRAVREPEPYKGKGIKYDYEVILRKEGKTGK